MYGCWQSLSYVTPLFLLNAHTLANFAAERLLRQLCRSFNNFFYQQRALDAAGGSSDMAAPLEPSALARLCRSRANAFERKRKPLMDLKEINVEALLAQGLSASDIDSLATRRGRLQAAVLAPTMGAIHADAAQSRLWKITILKYEVSRMGTP